MASRSSLDQSNYLIQWFRTWSDYQKEDFLQILATKLAPKSPKVNGVIEGVEGLDMNTSGRPPTIFTCQIKLFNDWWSTWGEEERAKLAEELKKIDLQFWTDLQSEMDGTRSTESHDFFAVEEVLGGPTVITVPASSSSSDAEIPTPKVQEIQVVVTGPGATFIQTESCANGTPSPSSSDAGAENDRANPEEFKTTIEVGDNTSETDETSK